MYVYILLTKKFKSAWARNEYTLFASSDVFGGHTYSCRRAKIIKMPTVGDILALSKRGHYFGY